MFFIPKEAGSPAAGATGRPARRPSYSERRQRLLELLQDQLPRAQAYITCHPQDIRYLTGVDEGILWLALSAGGCFAISRQMLIREVRNAAPELEVLLPSPRSTDRVDLEGFLVAELASRGLQSSLVESPRISASSYLALVERAETARVQVHQATEVLSRLRMIKDNHEEAVIRRCVAIAEQAFRELIEPGAAAVLGRSEREVALELEFRMLSLGADRQGFQEGGIIVASGPNSASAHHSPGTRRILPGEPLIIDWGAEVDGYRSDSTRTVFAESGGDFGRRAFPVVEEALRQAENKLRSGRAMGEVDHAARIAITSGDYPEFHYGVGHGIGLAIHEAPWIRAHSKDLLQEGMITTLEPGIYLPGTGGIRIENIYLITSSGYDRIGDLPTTLEAAILRRR